MTKLLYIGAGGALGAVARYLLSGWTLRLTGAGFPWGTLVVNVVGCALIGVLTAAFNGRWLVSDETRVLVTFGLLGGLTTFSTFSFETITFIADRQWARAALNVLLSNAICLAVAWFGYRVGQKYLGV